jgi:hydrogenase expression/formation protein HypC
MCLGIPGRILDTRLDGGIRFGRVQFDGIVRDVCLEAQPEAVPGDYVLVHVGFAIARIDPVEAEQAWRVLAGLGQTQELEVDGESRGRP